MRASKCASTKSHAQPGSTRWGRRPPQTGLMQPEKRASARVSTPRPARARLRVTDRADAPPVGIDPARRVAFFRPDREVATRFSIDYLRRSPDSYSRPETFGRGSSFSCRAPFTVDDHQHRK